MTERETRVRIKSQPDGVICQGSGGGCSSTAYVQIKYGNGKYDVERVRICL